MSSTVPILDYGKPRTRALGYLARVAAAAVSFAASLSLAVAACRLTYVAAINDNGSHGGCGTGRLHAEALILFGLVPAASFVVARTASLLGFSRIDPFLRMLMFAAVAGYGTLWLYLIGFMHFLKFGSFTA